MNDNNSVSKNDQQLQQLIMFRRGIYLKTIIAFSSPIISSRLIYPLSFFKNTPKQTQTATPSAPSKPLHTTPEAPKPNPPFNKTDITPTQIKKLLATIESKQHIYEAEQREKVRNILKKFDYSVLKQSKLEYLEEVLSLYLTACKDDIIKPEPKSEMNIYESFVKIMQRTNISKNFWKDVSRVYREISKLKIVSPPFHSKVPKLVLQGLKKRQRWEFIDQDLINILTGLAHREVLLKDQRIAIITIVEYFDRGYKDLNYKYVSSLVRTMAKAYLQNRFGLVLQAEENILLSFLHDLQAGKHEDLWQQKTYLLVEDNRYPADHKIMEQIIQIIVKSAFKLLDSHGQIEGSLSAPNFLKIIVNYSQKYSISKLSQTQKSKLLEFLKKQLSGEDTETAQNSIALMLSHNFFTQNNALKLIVEQSKTFAMTARLAYELSRVGYKIDQKFFLPLQSLQSRNIKAQVQNYIGREQLLILLVARMQLEMNLNSSYYDEVCGRYFSYLQAKMKDETYHYLLHDMLKLPQTALYYMHSLFDMKSLMKLVEDREVSTIYGVRNRYLYLLIRYGQAGAAEQSKWYKTINLNQFVCEVLEAQLMVDPSIRQYSTGLLVFFNFYLQKALKAQAGYYRFLCVKIIIQYLTQMTWVVRQTGKISYQAPFFVIYWQIINTFLTHISEVQADIQWKLHLSQFLNILILAETPSHFFHTTQFKTCFTKLQQNIASFKPHYEFIADIIACGVNLGIINQQNIFKATEFISVKKDLYGEVKSIAELWMLPDAQKSKHESQHEIVKFVNSLRVYSPSETASIKEQIQKYDSRLLVKAIQLFSLPVNEASSQLYLHLFNQMKNREQIEQTQIDYTIVVSEVMKYLKGRTEVSGILNNILKRHFAKFNEFTLDYHLEIISSIGKMGCFNRDYERRFMVTVLRESYNPLTPVAAIACLAKNGFGFNYKELRGIEEYIRSAKANWLEVFLLLEDQILPELRKDVLSRILHHQKMYPHNKASFNNGLVHKYLEHSYAQIYNNSHFATLKQDKSYRQKPIISLPIPTNLRVMLSLLASGRNANMEVSAIKDNPCIVWKNLWIFFVHKVSTAQLQMLKRLFSSFNDANNNATVIKLNSSPQEAIKHIAEQLQLTLTPGQQTQAAKLTVSQVPK